MSIKRSYDENSEMGWDTWQEFMRKSRWPLISRSIINNHRFYDLLDNTTELEIPFDLRKVKPPNVYARPISLEGGPTTNSRVDDEWEIQRATRQKRRIS